MSLCKDHVPHPPLNAIVLNMIVVTVLYSYIPLKQAFFHRCTFYLFDILRLFVFVGREEHGSEKMLVISGVGTRHYYRKLGYELEGPYMVKKL